MIAVLETIVRRVDAATVDFAAIVEDRGGAGLRKLVARDRFEIVVAEAEVPGCPRAHMWEVGTIDQARFPIAIDGFDCQDRPYPPQTLPLRPAWEPGPGPAVTLPCSPLLCTQNPACERAERDAWTARNELVLLCHRNQQLRRRRTELLVWAALLTAEFLALTIAAGAAWTIPFVGAAIAVALTLAAAAVLGILTSVTVYLARVDGQLAENRRELDRATGTFLQRAAEVRRVCCRDCIDVDLTLPSCGN